MARYFGTSAPRKEGIQKVTGKAVYIDDLKLAGIDLLFGITIRSQTPRARIKNIVFEKGVNWDEFTVVTAKDIPGKNIVTLIEADQPYLADKEYQHAEEPIVLLAHKNKYELEKARGAIKIEIEELPAIFSIDDSKKIFKTFLIEKGNVDSAWEMADFLVEGVYETGAQEQLYIETNGVVAKANEIEGVTVWGSLQCPYYVHKALMPLFDLPSEKVRVIQMETGGGFGGKEEYPNLIAGHAALLAWKSGKTVKMIYDRAEDMAATTKRHPSKTKIKTAVTKDGKLLAQEINFSIDAGAYVTLSPVVLSRGTIHAAGPYVCPNVRINSKAFATNLPPHGAFRGFGAPQSIFAMERHLEKVAKAVGLSSEALREKNFLSQNELTATSQSIKENINLSKILRRALIESDYHNKKKKFSNQTSKIKRGIGFCTFMHGAGFTGSGEKTLASKIAIELTKEGTVRVLAAVTEIGQGKNTVFSQIVADCLGIEIEAVEIAQPDTQKVPDSGPTVASRTSMVIGKLVESAAIAIRENLLGSGFLKNAKYSPKEFVDAAKNYVKEHGELKTAIQYKQPSSVVWDDSAYRGDAYAAFAWAAYVASVAVDMDTYEVKVEDFVAVQEVGNVINPTLAEGQIEGGVAQGIGYAIYEKVNWKNGRMANNQMTNYIMPTAADLPPIRVFFEKVEQEKIGSYGPSGAKGIGELPMDGPGPAIANAIENALGVEVNSIPFLPEDIFNAVGGVA